MPPSTAYATLPPADARIHDALDAMDQGFLWLDQDLLVRRHNQAYRRLLDIEGEQRFIGQPYSTLLAFLHERGEFREHGEKEDFVTERLRVMEAGKPYRIERVRPNGVMLSVAAVPLQAGGYVYTYLDVTREARALEEVQRTAKATVVAMANFAEHRDTDTGVHVLRVARLVGQIAEQLKAQGHFPEILDAAFVRQVRIASILHDVGKISTPDRILLKPGPLSDDERKTMMQHPAMGAQLLRQAHLMMGESSYLRIGTDIALTHHEWYDGSGYPSGLAGEDIPLSGRICAIADVFDALMSRRPYKAPWTTEQALDYVTGLRGTQFDPAVTDALLTVIRQREAVSIVQWNDTMSVGNQQIDEQHMILMDTINQLATAESQNDRPLVGMIIDELISYASFHFYFEEQLMADAGYPDLEKHRKIHQGFTRWITDVREDFIHLRRTMVGTRILNFLRDWLRNHILEEDQLYRSHLDRHKAH